MTTNKYFKWTLSYSWPEFELKFFNKVWMLSYKLLNINVMKGSKTTRKTFKFFEKCSKTSINKNHNFSEYWTYSIISKGLFLNKELIQIFHSFFWNKNLTWKWNLIKKISSWWNTRLSAEFALCALKAYGQSVQTPSLIRKPPVSSRTKILICHLSSWFANLCFIQTNRYKINV